MILIILVWIISLILIQHIWISMLIGVILISLLSFLWFIVCYFVLGAAGIGVSSSMVMWFYRSKNWNVHKDFCLGRYSLFFVFSLGLWIFEISLFLVSNFLFSYFSILSQRDLFLQYSLDIDIIIISHISVTNFLHWLDPLVTTLKV